MNFISHSSQISHCSSPDEHHCLTCSDEALSLRVLRLDQEGGLAFVEIGQEEEAVDITLLENVAPGDMLLVHAGVALVRLEKGVDYAE